MAVGFPGTTRELKINCAIVNLYPVVVGVELGDAPEAVEAGGQVARREIGQGLLRRHEPPLDQLAGQPDLVRLQNHP